MRHYVKCLFLALMMAVGSAVADTLTIPYSFTPGETITAAKFNSNFGAVTTVVNGNLDDSNIKVGANIATSKLNLASELPVLRSASNRCVSAGVTGDTVPRVSMTSSGMVSFGAGGSSAQDMAVKREDANTLAIRDAGDTAYKNFKAGAGTFSGAVSGITGTFTGALTADSLTLTTPLSSNIAAINGGRLTLTSGTPVTTSDVTAAGTIYWEPFVSDQIALWNGSAYQVVSVGSNKSLSLTATSGSMYDVYGYLSGGTLALESLVWTDTTTRATAVVRDATGVLSKSGDRTRRYLGSFYATDTNQTEDSGSRRCLFNAVNRVPRFFRAADTTDSWSYGSTTWRNFNNNTTDGVGQITIVQGLAETPVNAVARSFGLFNANTQTMYTGIGVDSATVNSAQIMLPIGVDGGYYHRETNFGMIAEYQGYMAIGKHTIAPLESTSSETAATFYGDNGGAMMQSGLTGSMEM